VAPPGTLEPQINQSVETLISFRSALSPKSARFRMFAPRSAVRSNEITLLNPFMPFLPEMAC
jgi:hypothetical protein